MKQIEVRESPLHGKGVFAVKDIKEGEVIVESHMVLIHVNEELPEELATLQFPWTEDFDAICLSDTGSFFNHNSHPSAKVYERDFSRQIQSFITTRDISPGEEITIYYNDAFDRFISE